jgi:hypothetical protein
MSQRDADAQRIARLEDEVGRLNVTVAHLASELSKVAVQPTQETKIATLPSSALSAIVPLTCSSRDQALIEDELQRAQRALLRVIERLELSTEARRALLQGLRPVRALDRANPWVAATDELRPE